MRAAANTKKMLHNHHLSQKGRSFIAKVNRASSHFSKDARRYITKKPYQALGIVMLAGVCVAFLIHRH